MSSKKHSIRLMMPDVGDLEMRAIQEVLNSGQLVEGAQAHNFEKLISKHAGATHTVLCTSATTGLEMALKILNLEAGSEVLIPAFTHPATLLAVLNTGLTPVFVDVDRKTFNTNVELLRSGITDKTKVLMPVSWGGYPIEMNQIMKLAKEHDLIVIEDAACALGTSMDNIPTGQGADMTVFSFHPRKLIALGDGGAISTNNEKYYNQLKRLKHFGSVTVNGRASFVELGSNYRLSNVLAAMGVPQLERIESTIKVRTEVAQYYNQLFANSDWCNIPHVTATSKPNYQSYCISMNTPGFRDFALSAMKEMGIEVQFGTYSVDREPVSAQVKKVGDLRDSHFLGDNLLTLPLHHRLTRRDQEIVFEELNHLHSKFQNLKN